MSRIEFTGIMPDYTMIPDKIILKHLKNSSGSEVKVLFCLYMMQQKNIAPSMEEISKVTGLSDLDIISSCDGLSQKGIIKLESMDAAGNMEINMYPGKKSDSASAASDEEKPSGDGTFKNLLSQCEQVAGGPLSPQLVGFLMDLTDTYGFSEDLIIYLFSYSRERNAFTRPYMEKIASDWKNEGLDTLEKVLQYHTANRETYQRYREFLKYAGLNSGNVTQTHREFLDRWEKEYGFSMDMVRYACDVSVSSTGRADLNYMESVLKNLKESGITTPEEARNKKSDRSPKKPGGFTGYVQRDGTDYDKIIMGWDPDED